MKANFKPLGLAAAVAAATAGFVGAANAQSVLPTAPSIAGNGLGDLALVPYYTVQGDFVTGVHIINTSNLTQVVKLRLRRGSDSMDALDINLILSPYDEWTGFLDDSSGNVVLATDDSSCTAPIRESGRFEMPSIYREGAEEGYIEVIAMASAGADEPISEAALHDSTGTPVDCGAVAENFFSTFPDDTGDTSVIGNHTNSLTIQKWDCDGDPATADTTCPSNYLGSNDVLAVSYFVRDAASGLEFGNKAVHIAGFMSGDGIASGAMMSNQEAGIFSGDPTGFDYPDLNGGLPLAGQRALGGGPFDALRSVMGIYSVLNDWSTNPALNVATDWVVTFPGQYAMLDQPLYFLQDAGAIECGGLNTATPGDLTDFYPDCDYRDLPVTAKFIGLYDREEQTIEQEDGDLVISPNLSPEAATTQLRYEVNVVEWTDGSGAPSVLDSEYAISVNVSALGEPYGWAELTVDATETHDQQICDFNLAGTPTVVTPAGAVPYGNCSSDINSGIPMVGFVAWERSFPSDPSANYGRIVEHSWTSVD